MLLVEGQVLIRKRKSQQKTKAIEENGVMLFEINIE